MRTLNKTKLNQEATTITTTDMVRPSFCCLSTEIIYWFRETSTLITGLVRDINFPSEFLIFFSELRHTFICKSTHYYLEASSAKLFALNRNISAFSKGIKRS